MRGRVMALYMAIFVGGTPLGAPLVGWVADAFGPRWALGVAAIAGGLAATVVLFWMVRYRRLRVQLHPFTAPRVRVLHAGDGRDAERETAAERNRETATREIAIVEATSPR
jgi:MFS family permease